MNQLGLDHVSHTVMVAGDALKASICLGINCKLTVSNNVEGPAHDELSHVRLDGSAPAAAGSRIT